MQNILDADFMGSKLRAEKLRCQKQLGLSQIRCLRSEDERDGNTSGKVGLRKPQSQQLNLLGMWETPPGLKGMGNGHRERDPKDSVKSQGQSEIQLKHQDLLKPGELG